MESSHPTDARQSAARQRFTISHSDDKWPHRYQFSRFHNPHYLPGVDLAISPGDFFILGDAQGTDILALDDLPLQGGPDIKDRITIYPSRPHNIAKFEAIRLTTSTDPPEEAPADRRSTRAEGRRQGDPRARHLWRDPRITRASDYDILWTKSDEEARALYGDKYRPRISATKLHRLRRQEIAEETKRVCRGKGRTA